MSTKSNKDSNCSCSSCLFKTESDRQSIRDFLEHGSRIDRLYYGKYIPLREKKLLKRLVRTKAVYDDLRAQILSDSTLSIRRKRKYVPRNNVKLPSMTDENGDLSSKNLSECCSCCSCSSKINIHDEVPKTHKHRGAYKVMYRTEHYKTERGGYGGKKGVRFKTKHIRSDPCTCTFKLSGLLKKYSKMKLKKHHTSSPPQVPFDLESMAEEYVRPKRSLSATLHQNLKHQKELVTDAISEGVKKLSDSKTKIKENLELHAKRSLEKLKRTVEKIKSSKKTDNQKGNVEKSTESKCVCPERDLVSHIKKDSIVKFKDDLRKKHKMKEVQCEPECDEHTCDPKECYIKLRQSEPLKIKPQLRKRIQIKETKRTNKRTDVADMTLKKTASSGESINVKPLIHIKSKQEAEIKTKNEKQEQRAKIVKKPIKIQKPARNIKNIQPIRERNSRQAVRIGSSFSFNIEFYKNINAPSAPTDKMYKPESHSSKQSVSKRYAKKTNSKCTCRNRSSQSEVNITKPRKKKTPLKRCFCTLSFRGNKGKTFKNKIREDKARRLKHTQTETFSDFYSGDKLSEPKHTNKMHRQVETPLEISQFVPRPCDPGICIPDQCDPYNCIKIMNMRPAKIKKRSVKCLCSGTSLRSRGTKSISSLTHTSTSYVQSVIKYKKKPKKVQVDKARYIKKRVEKPKIYEKQIVNDNRQAVRIGSTFSFNIEFYKNRDPLSLQSGTRPSLLIKPKYIITKPQKKQKIQNKMARKNRQTSSDHHVITAKKKVQYYKKHALKTGLERCFCTLKLQEHKYLKKKRKRTHSTATETVENSYFDILTLNRGTKMERKRMDFLEPFECEPFVCVPGECDPYECLERIKKRHKDASAITSPFLRTEGSSTGPSEISSKFIQAQPKYKFKNEKTHTKKNKRNKKLKLDERFSDDLRGKQSVNIGSSFSFNIEFQKRRLPTALPPIEYSPKSKITKSKTTNNQIFSVASQDTQIEKPRKHHKSFMMRPLIKRCFCTLNLQKKQKQHLLNNFYPHKIRHNVYTVNRILTKNTCRHHNCNKHNDDEMHMSNVIKNNSNRRYAMSVDDLYPYLSKESIQISERIYNKGKIRSLRVFQSTLHMLQDVQVNSINNDICPKKPSPSHNIAALPPRNSFVTYTPSDCLNILRFKNNEYAKEITTFPSILNQMQRHHVSQYYKKCFCTMNLHLEHKYPKHFLHPQECEPGVCIPGQCDPNECIKLIMRRARKHRSIDMNTGKIRTRSGSSSTYPFASKSTKPRKELLLKNNFSESPKGTFHRSNNGVVRIGSSFSFDIEFFKQSGSLANNQRTLVAPQPPYKKIKKIKNKSSKSFKTLGTRINENIYRNMESQSDLNRGAHKGSVTLPMLNRCFCTLKLQKKGKMYKKIGTKLSKHKHFNDQDVIKIKTSSKSQNTKKIKPPYRLLPYECEPNICDPGNCDPYECLDIMTRRMKYKNLGVDPILNKNKSVYSITTKNKSRGSQSLRRYRAVPKSQQSLTLGSVDLNSNTPSKQAVRIGSNFSFSIEFFKDRPQHSLEHRNISDGRYVKRISDFDNTLESRVKPPEALRLKPIRHKKSQVQNIIKRTSSMTSTFAKRCFCTAKLQRSNKTNVGLNLEQHPRSSFLKKCLCWIKESQVPRLKVKNEGINSVIKRCFCTMQLYNKKVKNNLNNYRTKTRTKSIMTADDTSNVSLLPYECEPGVCIPYQCDPHKCDKLIQARIKEKHIYQAGKPNKRTLLPYECEPLTCIPGECNPIECLKRIKKREYQTKTFGTTAGNHMYTASTITKMNNRLKNKRNQSYIRKNFVTPSTTSKNVFGSNLNKQSVRIGSTFSFDIQFYKNTNVPDLRSYHKDTGYDEYSQHTKGKPKNIMVKQKPQQTSVPPALLQKHTQLQKPLKSKENNTDPKAFYKRCFCILNLNKFKTKPRPIPTKSSKIATDLSIDNNINRLSVEHKLLPYECEPGVCIPGLCDPLECKKRIDKRHLKEFNQQTRNIVHSKKKGTKTITGKSVKLQIPKSLQQKERQNLKHFENGNTNRSVCRIGSEFSFNIEFFKTGYQNPDVHIGKVVDSEKRNNKINRTSNTTLMRNYAVGRHKHKLIQRKPSQRSVMSNVTPAHFNERKRKSRDATSQVVKRRSNKSIGMKALKYKNHIQTNFVKPPEDLIKPNNLKPKERLAETSVIGKPSNKQAVKIGSNVSFQIEFFKDRPPKTELANISDDHRNSRPKRNAYSKPIYSKSRTLNTQVKEIPSKTKGLQASNVLKRCFCTLKLQDMKSKSMKNNIPQLGGIQHYPQVLEVRRVSIQRKPKQIAQQTISPVKSIATQSKTKPKKRKNVNKQCECYILPTTQHDNSNEMQTILPYKPKKFNKSNSKTLLTNKNIGNFNNDNTTETLNKKLDRKRSNRGINIVKHPKQNTDKEVFKFNVKNFFCQCVQLLSLKKDDNKNNNVTQHHDLYNDSKQPANKEMLRAQDILKLCQEEYCPVKTGKLKSHTEESKPYKYDKKKISRSQTAYPIFVEKYPLHQNDNENIPPSKFKNRRIKNKNNMSNYKSKPDGHCTCHLFREHTNSNMEMNTLCLFCQKKMQEEINRNNLSSPRLNVRFLDPLVTSQIDFLDKKKKNHKSIKSSRAKSHVQKRCRSCGRLINAEEVRKGAGDNSEYRKKPKPSESCTDKLKRFFSSKKCSEDCENKVVHKPAFEMLLNSSNYDIMNKDDILGNIANLSPNKKERKLKNTVLNVSGNNKYISKSGKLQKKKPQPCTCGSLICAENNKIEKNVLSPQGKKNLWKQCACGSPICSRESAIMKGILMDPNEISCHCEKIKNEEMTKFKTKKQKETFNKSKIRQKRQLKEDQIRRRKRRKMDKEREKKINKNSSDLILCAESMIDIGKLGISACTDILRGVIRISANPKEAIRKLKDMKDNPSLIARNLKIAVDDSGVVSTVRRIRLRCLAMRGVKRIKRILENYPVTRYLLYITDKDPKKRLVKPKRRERERFDYGNSLYMASLRRKKFVCVYDRWPQLYPHFMSLVTLYKQLRDILLFLLAVVVWSPCILCTEICRAMACCIFCTG